MPESGYNGGPYGRLQPQTPAGYTPHSAVSSFNFPLQYDHSTLTTPISLNTESPAVHSKDAHWHRSEPNTMQYRPRSYESSYQYQSIHSKSKESQLSSLSLSVPSDDMPLSISPYVFDSPQSQCPPTPYWGSYSVSAPQSDSTPVTASTSTPPNNNLNVPSSSLAPQNRAPILQAPTPANLRPNLKRAHDENLSPQAHQQAQKTQQQLQKHQAQQQVQRPQSQQQSAIFSQSPHLKHESPDVSPTSATSIFSHSSKRRKLSSPPTSASNPNSAHPSTPQMNTPRLNHGSIGTSTEDEILLHLREIVKVAEKSDWKKIVEMFHERTGKMKTVSCLQMRYTRLRERSRLWSDVDYHALEASKQKFPRARWNSIAVGMLEFGCELKWSPGACARKWAELHPEDRRSITPKHGSRQNSRFTMSDDGSEDSLDVIATAFQQRVFEERGVCQVGFQSHDGLPALTASGL